MKKIKVRITKTANWYKKGEEHEVLNRVVFDFIPVGTPCFQKGKGFYGIECSHCKILSVNKDVSKRTKIDKLITFAHNFNILTGI